MKNLIIILISALLFTACAGRQSGTLDLSPLYSPSYSEGFEIGETGGRSTVITVHNPWQGADGISMQVFVSRDGELPPEGFDGAVVHAPVRKVVCMSSSYVAFIDALDETESICGISGAAFIASERVQEADADGRIREVGYDSNTNFELIAAMQPDLVLVYGLEGENTPLTGKLAELSVEFMYIGEYVEQSPLGKAEWIVLFGELFDKREQAEEIFTSVENDYNDSKNFISRSIGKRERPIVMLNAPWRDTWFVPGDRSYMVRLLEDAGGRYACTGVDDDITRPISTERAFIYAMESDVWLNPGQVKDMGELLAGNPRFGSIPPVAGRRVYNNNLRSTAGGGNDFWESGAVRPDLVLRDLVEIFHPGIMPRHELYYFRRIE